MPRPNTPSQPGSRTSRVARACVLLLGLAVLWGMGVEHGREMGMAAFVVPDPHVARPASQALLATLVDHRPRYRHSVVSGGVRSADEAARAMREDPVVAAHYRDVHVSDLTLETVGQGRTAYVSYRIGHRVYWTRRPVALREGELLLSDGREAIRARCGNRLSDTPRQPVSEVEPAVLELEDLVSPRPGVDVIAGGQTDERGSVAGGATTVPFLDQAMATGPVLVGTSGTTGTTGATELAPATGISTIGVGGAVVLPAFVGVGGSTGVIQWPPATPDPTTDNIAAQPGSPAVTPPAGGGTGGGGNGSGSGNGSDGGNGGSGGENGSGSGGGNGNHSSTGGGGSSNGTGSGGGESDGGTTSADNTGGDNGGPGGGGGGATGGGPTGGHMGTGGGAWNDTDAPRSVPEPTAVVLVGAGLVAAMIRQRRARR